MPRTTAIKKTLRQRDLRTTWRGTAHTKFPARMERIPMLNSAGIGKGSNKRKQKSETCRDGNSA
jgi:hypothetical protein